MELQRRNTSHNLMMMYIWVPNIKHNVTAQLICKDNLMYGVSFQMQIVLSTISVYTNNRDIYR